MVHLIPRNTWPHTVFYPEAHIFLLRASIIPSLRGIWYDSWIDLVSVDLIEAILDPAVPPILNHLVGKAPAF